MGLLTTRNDNKATKTSFGYARYLGGNTSLGRKHQNNLVVTDKAIGIGVFNPKHNVLQWTDVVSVDVSGEQVGKSKVGATLAFGAFGGLVAKGSKNQAAVAVHTKDKQVAYYLVDKVSAIELRAKITPILRAAGVPFTDELQQSDSSQDNNVTNELTQLARLKQQGILTEAEFVAKKRQLLGL